MIEKYSQWFSNFLVSGHLYTLKNITENPKELLFMEVIFIIVNMLEIKAEIV